MIGGPGQADGRPGRGLEVAPHGCRVDRSDAQGARYRSTPFGELEALQVGVQPGTSPGEGTTRVDDGEVTLGTDVPDHPQQDGPLVTTPAPDARPDRTRGGARDAVGATEVVGGEPDTRSSAVHSTPMRHDAGPEAPSAVLTTGVSPSCWAVSGRMSIFHPVNLAARRAFWPSLPMASDSW